jgi:hypothetical protein
VGEAACNAGLARVQGCSKVVEWSGARAGR